MVRVFMVSLIIIFLGMESSFAKKQEAVDPALADYKEMLQWQFSETPVRIQGNPVRIERDCATVILNDGEVRLMKPTASGRITGMYFEGTGTFKMNVPDANEIDQYRRLTEEPVSSPLELPFTECYLRTSEELLNTLFTQKNTQFAPLKQAEDRQLYWLHLDQQDIDARVFSGIMNEKDTYFIVAFKTKHLDWLTFTFDGTYTEEITLERNEKRGTSILISLDRAEDRLPSGAVSKIYYPQTDISDISINADLTESSWAGSGSYPSKAHYRSTVTFSPLKPGQRVIKLFLFKPTEVTEVTSVDGVQLPFIRDPIGKRFNDLSEDIYDNQLLIIYPETLEQNRKYQVNLRYTAQIYNGDTRIPENGYDENYTIRFSTEAPKNATIIATGNLIEEKVEKKTKKMTWEMSQPRNDFGFSISKDFEVQKLSFPGMTKVDVYGFTDAYTENVGIDVAKTLEFYKWFFGFLPEMQTFTVDCRGYTVGQNLIGIGRGDSFRERPGISEYSRATRVADLYFDYLVKPKTNRDAILTTAFPEYMSLLYLQTTLPEKHYYDEVIASYVNTLIGSAKIVNSKVADNWGADAEARRKWGPISMGWRAGFMNLWDRGVVVLHMLRTMLRNMSGSETLFRTIMQDFVKTYSWKSATIEDFIATVLKHTDQDITWFFKQWFYAVDIPTYTYSESISDAPGADGKYTVTVNVQQSDVPEHFKMPIPIQVNFKKANQKLSVMVMDQMKKTVTLSFDAQPESIVFNPDNAVLARVKKSN